MTWNPEKIKDLRLRMGLSSSQLAQKLNCDSVDIYSAESGEYHFTAEQISMLNLLFNQAEACSLEISEAPMAEQILEKNELMQIDLITVKKIFSENN